MFCLVVKMLALLYIQQSQVCSSSSSLAWGREVKKSRIWNTILAGRRDHQAGARARADQKRWVPSARGEPARANGSILC